MYKLMVLHWSIFTLSTQLILCASIYSNSDSTFTDEQQQLVIKSEIFCNQELEKTLPENGVESSLMLDLHPGRTLTSCKRFFRAPESHGFFIRLHKPIQNYGINNSSNSSSTNGTKKLQNTSKDVANKASPFNSTDYCPISITSLEDDQQPPWRFDPCQLQLNGGVEEPVRILQGRLRILWVHGGNNPNYKLSLTVLGKGEPCRDKSKHPCLKFGDEPLLCISQDLICDGVRQCPIGGEMFSDEDDQLCENQRGDLHLLQRPTIWQHLTLGIFQNIFGPMESTSAITSMNPVRNNSLDIRPTVPTNPFTDMKTMESERNANSNVNNNQNINNNNNNNNNNSEQSKTKTTEAPNNLKFVKSTRKITSRSSLSRYGSWGYMMLGMLMCSVVLLMCGIWECIRRVQKNDVMDAFNAAGEQIDSIPPNVRDDDENCPQYDPPPPYSSLFPLAKDFNSTTNSESATNSIYFTSASASYGPTSPPSPPSIDTIVLPQNSSNSQRININARNNIENNDNQTNA